MPNKCVFLDRDGVLNRERGDYTYKLQDFVIIAGVPEAIKLLKEKGFLTVVITNQAGIAKGIYSRKQMQQCHDYLIKNCINLIDAIYYCPHHPSFSASIARKPDSLMFEKAMAKFNIDPAQSWMVGDKERDMIPAKKLGIQTIGIGEAPIPGADLMAKDLLEAVLKLK